MSDRGVVRWYVRAPGVGQRDRMFEDEGRAWQCAREGAAANDPAVLTEPDGRVFYVFAQSDYTEVSTRPVLGNVTRKVVDPS